MEQLQCLGILQTCEVLKVGMPTRVTYTELKEVSHCTQLNLLRFVARCYVAETFLLSEDLPGQTGRGLTLFWDAFDFSEPSGFTAR